MRVPKMMMKVFLLVLFCSAAQAAQPPVLLVVGDSLSAGYGIPAREGWVTLLARKLESQGSPTRVVNASISGDTTAGGLSRLPALLERHQPTLVLIELGANDGLRALPVAQMKKNLSAMTAMVRAKKAQPVLFEMRIPSNYGAAYTTQFTAAFGEIAKAEKLPMVPFFLMPIVGDAKAFLDDGIHPTAASQPKLLDAVWPTLKPLVK